MMTDEERKRMAKIYTLYACIPPNTSMDDPRVVELNQMLEDKCWECGVSISAPELLLLLTDYEAIHDEDDGTITFYGRWEEDGYPYFVIHENDSSWAYIHRWIPGWHLSGMNLVYTEQKTRKEQWMAMDYNTRYLLGLMFSDSDNPFMLEWYTDDDAWKDAQATRTLLRAQGLNGYGN